nr:MAG TPA: hypothetical protein [Caudoviricetes sp.]
MKTYDRELELGFEVSAAQAIKAITRENMIILQQNIIHQTWLEEGEVSDYKFRTRIRRTEIAYPDAIISWVGKCEFTTKYSKSDEQAAVQDNMELNAEITPEEYEKLKKIYAAAGKEEVVKIRTYFRTPLNTLSIYTLDTYPNEKGDRARIEIEFKNKQEMEDWRAPDWLQDLVLKR